MTWVVLGDSVTGTAHTARNVPCQDALRYRTFGAQAERLVVAVADGAGSALHADVGAMITCDELIRLAETLPRDLLKTHAGMTSLFATVRDRLLVEADCLVVRPRDLACTALVAVVEPDFAAFAQLGDGAIVFSAEGNLQTVFWPEPGEYANVTDFLTDDKYADAIQFRMFCDPIAELALFTDGLQRLALDFANRIPHVGFFQPIFRDLRAAADLDALREPFRAFLDSSQVNNRTDDDKTLVLVVRGPAHAITPSIA